MVFCDTDISYKRPFGAVTTGEPVRYRLKLTGVYESANMMMWRDGHDSPSLFPMSAISGGFEIEHTFDEEGIYFYCFALSDGSYIHRNACIEPTFGRDWTAFQQTVFCADYIQPKGYAGGVMYQIFPDRFSIGGGVCDTPFSDRKVHSDLNDVPDFRLDADGIMRNNDYFGGNLKGIEQKIPYLNELGVTCIYLNPICESHSNHRYDTASYMRLDPMLGTRRDFTDLCETAHANGIKIVLDGVFSHTGADSEYFNKYGRYDTVGAYQSKDSRYYSWFKFEDFPEKYRGWWGFDTLPEIIEEDESFVDYVCGRGGVIDHWLNLGADGFRLDVADELPDAFIEQIRTAVKRNGADKILIGEVWEDASNKVSYGSRRRFLYGKELDSVMNYPFRGAIIDFVRHGNAGEFMLRVNGIVSNYPKPMLDLMMNMLSTHDTERAINALVVGSAEGMDREHQHKVVIEDGEYLRGVEMLKLATVLQFALPGIPCIYYGDEIGMQGMRDPFNRMFMRWDGIDQNVLGFFKEMSKIRRSHTAFADGDFVPVYASDGVVAFLRKNRDETVLVALNRSDETRTITAGNGWPPVTLEPWKFTIVDSGQ